MNFHISVVKLLKEQNEKKLKEVSRNKAVLAIGIACLVFFSYLRYFSGNKSLPQYDELSVSTE